MMDSVDKDYKTEKFIYCRKRTHELLERINKEKLFDKIQDATIVHDSYLNDIEFPDYVKIFNEFDEVLEHSLDLFRNYISISEEYIKYLEQIIFNYHVNTIYNILLFNRGMII